MSSNTQNLSSVEMKATPLVRLDNILEASLGEILDPLVSDQSKEVAAREIINSVKRVMPKNYWQRGKEEKVQAVSTELRNKTGTLEALVVVQDWAADRLDSKENDPGSVAVDKKALRWINSRATNLDFVIGNRAGILPTANGVALA